MDIDAIIEELHKPDADRDFLDEVAEKLDGTDVSIETMMAAEALSTAAHLAISIIISLEMATLLDPDGQPITVNDDGKLPEEAAEYLSFLSLLVAIARKGKSIHTATLGVIKAFSTPDGKQALAKETLDALRKNPKA